MWLYNTKEVYYNILYTDNPGYGTKMWVCVIHIFIDVLKTQINITIYNYILKYVDI